MGLDVDNKYWMFSDEVFIIQKACKMQHLFAVCSKLWKHQKTTFNLHCHSVRKWNKKVSLEFHAKIIKRTPSVSVCTLRWAHVFCTHAFFIMRLFWVIFKHCCTLHWIVNTFYAQYIKCLINKARSSTNINFTLDIWPTNSSAIQTTSMPWNTV